MVAKELNGPNPIDLHVGSRIRLRRKVLGTPLALRVGFMGLAALAAA